MFKLFSRKKKDSVPVENIVTGKDKKRDAYVKEVMEAAKWSYEEEEKKLISAKKKHGILYKDYVRYKFYRIPEEQYAEKYQKILEQRRVNKENREMCINETVKATGWSREEAISHIDATRKRTGCKYIEYFLYKFYKLTEEEQDTYPLIVFTRKLSAKYNTNPKFAQMLNDKSKTNEYFSEFVGRPWCINTKVTVEEFKEIFLNCKRIIYKPIEGIGGYGIQSFYIEGNNMEQIYKELTSLPAGVVEEYIVQHPALSALSPSAVNTMRIVTICSKTEPVTEDGRYMDIAYAGLRIGGGTGVVDNFHNGGMVAGIDLASGTLVTNAADRQGNVFETHPVTGVTIKGFEIPYFKEALELVTEACKKELVVGNLGWDIAITENGPTIIEVNIGPGARLLQVPYVAEGKGMKHVLEKYL